jgi:hypothetical protein
MSAYDRPDNLLAIFKNDERRNDNDPPYRGQGKVDGREYWVSAWVNETKAGAKVLLR